MKMVNFVWLDKIKMTGNNYGATKDLFQNRLVICVHSLVKNSEHAWLAQNRFYCFMTHKTGFIAL